MTVFGPDVSQYQKGLVPPDPAGIGFGICRASIGQYLDATCLGFLDWFRDNGVPYCAYHFAYPIASHPARIQADTFHRSVAADPSVNCMIDWEEDGDDNCHPNGGPQKPSWSDVLAVATEIRNLGHKVTLVYAPDWWWSEQGKPNMAGAGFDLVAAEYGPKPWPTGTTAQVYAARGGDASPDWKGYGGLTPVLLQFSCQVTWGNKALDMNAYRGDPAVLNRWFTKETPNVATYPYAYSGTMVTMEQMEAKKTVRNLHPEFWRRFKALMEYAEANGVQIGVGTGWRIQPDPPPPGFAQAGNSNHEGFPADGVSGGAVAIDAVVSASFPWMEKNLPRFGLRSFLIPSTTGYKGSNEPWHVQPAEIPASRMWRTTPWKLNAFPLPTDPAPTPTPPPTTGSWATDLMKAMPVLVKGAKGTPVLRLQHFLALAGEFDAKNMANFDGVFGSGTDAAVKRFETSHKQAADGRVDSVCWDLFMAAGDGIPELAKGMGGVDVQRMQRMLSANGKMDPSNQGNFDGQFGSGTETALKSFQTTKGLTADGKCGQKTWTSLLNG